MRVVLDTNVLISAALKPDGLEAAVVNAVVTGGLELWATAEVWSEYEEVLARPKFAAIREMSRRILNALETRARRTRPRAAGVAASDPGDNRFVECAYAADAHFLITGNLRHYPSEWGRTRAVNSRQFLECMLSSRRSDD